MQAAEGDLAVGAPLPRIGENPGIPPQGAGRARIQCPLCTCTPLCDMTRFAYHCRQKHAGVLATDPLLARFETLVNCPGCSLLFQNASGLRKHQSRCRGQEEDRIEHPVAAPAVVMEENQPEVENHLDLIPLFRQPLKYTHRTWRPLIQKIVTALLSRTYGNAPEAVLEKNFLAFTLLPGIVREIYIKSTEDGSKVVDKLRALAEAGNVAHELIQLAHLRVEAVRARTRQQRRPMTKHGVLKLIESLTTDERFSAACNLLPVAERLSGAVGVEEITEPLTTEEYRARVSALHPRGNEEDELPPAEEEGDPTPHQINSDHVIRGIGALQFGSAQGVSGWTFKAIKEICLHRSKENNDVVFQSCVDSIAGFFNACLRGELPSSVIALLTASRSVLIPKQNDPGSYRPLGIGESWYRVLGRIVMANLGERVGERLLPLQLAVGIKGGVEIAGRMCQMIFDHDPEYAVGGMDMKNAFNSMRRKPILEGIRRYCPSLVSFFRSVYGSAGILRNSKGEVVGTSATGVRQGDPLAFLFYCCGLQKFLIRLAEIFDGLCGDRFHILYSYADDIHIGGPADACEAFLNSPIPEELERAGISFVLRKFKLVGRSVTENAPYTTSREGTTFLGAPCGTETHVRIACLEAVQSARTTLGSLRLVGTQSAVLLMQQCINRRLGYIARVVDRGWAAGAWHEFDLAISKALAELIDLGALPPHLLEQVTTVRGLPEALGGLNIPAYVSPNTECGLQVSRGTIEEFLQRFVPQLIDQLEAFPKTGVARYRDVMATRDMDTIPDYVILNTWKSTANSMLAEKQDLLARNLAAAGKGKESRWLVDSAYPHSARWMRWRGGHKKQLIWTSEQLKAALRLRLLLPISGNRNATRVLRCPCGSEVDTDPWHCLDCRVYAGIANNRHNKVRDILGSYVKAVKNGAGSTTPEVDAPGTGKRADLMVRDGAAQITYIDVSITNTCSNGAMRLARGEDALERQRVSKELEYQGLDPRDGRLVPFVLAATGKMENSAIIYANSFITAANSSRYFLKTKCFREISVTIAQHNAAMLLRCMGRALETE